MLRCIKSNFISFIILATILIGVVGCSKSEEGDFKIYYMKTQGDGISAVGFDLDTLDVEEAVEIVISELSTDPDSVEIRRTIPGNIEIVDTSIESAVLSIYFDGEYKNLSERSEVVMRAAIVKSLVGIDGIDSVIFYVDNMPLSDSSGTIIGNMTGEMFIDDYGSETEQLENTDLTLYFSNTKGTKLIKKTTNVYYNSNVSKERLLLDYLLQGSEDEDVQAVIPSQAKILGVTVTDGVCYVNFDSGFLNPLAGVDGDVKLYAIVNTLTELDNVEKVQILVEGGGQANNSSLEFELAKSYERDMSYVDE